LEQLLIRAVGGLQTNMRGLGAIFDLDMKNPLG
jgi:hypothetical protein